MPVTREEMLREMRDASASREDTERVIRLAEEYGRENPDDIVVMSGMEEFYMALEAYKLEEAIERRANPTREE